MNTDDTDNTDAKKRELIYEDLTYLSVLLESIIGKIRISIIRFICIYQFIGII